MWKKEKRYTLRIDPNGVIGYIIIRGQYSEISFFFRKLYKRFEGCLIYVI